MRLSQWQSKKGFVKSAQELSKNDTFMLLVEMLKEESPLNLPLPPQGVSADDRGHRLGLIEGYNLCLKNLQASYTMPQLPPEPLRARFRPPEPE
jgi:hypothetical protein